MTIWELHTELLPKDMQDYLFTAMKMKDGELGGILKIYSIFDIITAFNGLGILKPLKEEKGMSMKKWEQMEREIYRKYRRKVHGDLEVNNKRNNPYVSFEIYLPKEYHNFEDIYSLTFLLNKMLIVLEDLNLVPKSFKNLTNEEDLFAMKPITIKIRSSAFKRQWAKSPKISLVFLEILKLLYSPEKMMEKIKDVIGHIS